MVFVDGYHCNHGNHIFRLREGVNTASEGVTRLTTTMCKLSSLPTQAITTQCSHFFLLPQLWQGHMGGHVEGGKVTCESH